MYSCMVQTHHSYTTLGDLALPVKRDGHFMDSRHILLLPSLGVSTCVVILPTHFRAQGRVLVFSWESKRQQ